jgi:MFS family permease
VLIVNKRESGVVRKKGTGSLAIFQTANARRLLYVRLFGQAGDGILQTALATFVLFSPEREADPERIALSFAILLIPYSLIGPFVGLFIDSWSRRSILFRANILRVITMLAIAGVITGHNANLTLAILVLISLGINRFIQAALAASVPHVVEETNLVGANALYPTLGTASASLAVGLGLLIQHFVGNTDYVNAALIVIGAVFALVAAYFATRFTPIDLLGPHGVTTEVRKEFRNAITGFRAGVRRLIEAPDALLSMSSVALQRAVFGTLTVTALMLARTVWNASTDPDGAVTDFGYCAISAGVGALIAALISASLMNGRIERISKTMDERQSQLILIATFVTSTAVVTTIAGFLSATLPGIMISAFFLGCAGQFLKINADTTVQRDIDDAHRGRVFSIFDMLINVALVTGICIFTLFEVVRESLVIRVSIASSVLLVVVMLTGRHFYKSRYLLRIDPQ